MMNGILSDIARKQKNVPAGMVSVCSSNSFAIRAAMKSALDRNLPVLIEATANQVDQNGGYSGMKPADFSSFVLSLAREAGFPQAAVILGGDHLGPLTRRHLGEDEAMEYAETLVREYASAGFNKIHLDTSMRLADDPVDKPLPVSEIAKRGARLCRAAEESFADYQKKHPGSSSPLYVIGSEVPIPGGAQSCDDSVKLTSPDDCRETYDTYRSVFRKHGLDDAFSRVIALVVQTGAEFGDDKIFEYDREKNAALVEYGRVHLPIVFEGHSTDYQSVESLKTMVQDGIAILKVGPALTFAFREALFALESIEREVYNGSSWKASNFGEVLELVMLDNPGYWQNHYLGDAWSQRFARRYSFSDRARYYLGVPAVSQAINCLAQNINAIDVPRSLLSQYMPRELNEMIKSGRIFGFEDLILTHIGFDLDRYYKAILPESQSVVGDE